MKRLGYRGLLLSLAFSVLLLGGWTGQAAAAEELVFASWGGAYQEAIRKAWLEPFSKESGIEILEDTSPDMSKIKAMVETNTVSWDVVTGGGFSMIEGIGQGLFEKLPADKINQQHVYPDARNDYGVPSEIFSTCSENSLPRAATVCSVKANTPANGPIPTQTAKAIT